MAILYQIRKALNKALSPVGLSLERVEKRPWVLTQAVTAQVGRFSIQVPALNPLSTHYNRYPDYTGYLGRVARILKGKFPECAAIDIGANVGDTACIIKSAVDIPILCIEGDDFTFGFLERNLGQFQNARAFKMFLGEKSDTLNVSLDKGGWNTTLIPDQNGATRQVKIASLDDFLAGQPAREQYKLLKVDTEGFDCRILRGAKKFLGSVHPVVTFEYNRDNMAALGEKGLDTLAMLAELGYKQAAFHDCDGRFFTMTTLSDQAFIQDIHEYADGRNAAVYYFDLTLFHADDADVAEAFAKTERAWRAEATQKSYASPGQAQG